MRNGALVLLCLLPFTIAAELAHEDSRNIDLIRASRNVFDLGLRLQKSILASENGKNLALSPTSIAGVMALVLLGSVGKSHDELVNTLGFSADVTINRNHHVLFGRQLRELNAPNSSRTLYANAIFVDKDEQLRRIYKDFLHHIYNADASTVDFKDSNRSMDIINEWVSAHTDGKIPTLLRAPPSTRTRLVLASALYFSGQWLLPFPPKYTRKMPFSVGSGNNTREVEVDSMVSIAKYRYVDSDEYDCEILAIPYNDSANTFYILKPRDPKRKSLNLIMDEMDAEKIETLIDNTKMTSVVLRLPKMNIMSHSDLKRPFQELGIKTIFSPTDANFALMLENRRKMMNTEEELILKIGEEDIVNKQLKETLAALPNPGVHVDSVFHDAAISINEYGTEAAAATYVSTSRTATRFLVSSPFFFFIRNEPTRLVTFSAAVFDPTR